MPRETEAKVKVGGLSLIRKRLISAGAERLVETRDTDTYFDTPQRSLLLADKGLRLRRSHDEKTGAERLVVTYKGPRRPGAIKSRQEIEIEVSSAAGAAAMIRALGYAPIISFEKRRQTWGFEG
jgi:adenylate cyclase class 2